MWANSLRGEFVRNTSKLRNNIRLFTFSVNREITQFLEVAVQYPIYINLARAPMLSDLEIWRPLPDERYRPRSYGLGCGGKREKQSTRQRCHEVENGQDEVYGHNNNLCVLSRR